MIFSETITKLIIDYKNLLRKHFPTEQRHLKLLELELGRKHLKKQDEVELYYKVLRIMQDIEEWVKNSTSLSSWYSGIDEFLQHMKKSLSYYHVENDQVVHTTQTASRAVVEAIQLMALPTHRLNHQIANKLHECIEKLKKYGTRDQQYLLKNAFKKHVEREVMFFQPFLNKFEKPIFSQNKRTEYC